MFRVSYTVEGTWRLLKQHGWSRQPPACRAIERSDEAVELWKKEDWPWARAPRLSEAAGSCSRTRPVSPQPRRSRPVPDHQGRQATAQADPAPPGPAR
ncbi:winged helix-turn-helix domain-containing protein [Streptomyces sp. NPDC059169]